MGVCCVWRNKAGAEDAVIKGWLSVCLGYTENIFHENTSEENDEFTKEKTGREVLIRMGGIHTHDVTSLYSWTLASNQNCVHILCSLLHMASLPAGVHRSSAVLSWEAKVTQRSPVSAHVEAAAEAPTPPQSRQQQEQTPLNSTTLGGNLDFPQRGHATCDLIICLSALLVFYLLCLCTAQTRNSRAMLSTAMFVTCSCLFSVV